MKLVGRSICGGSATGLALVSESPISFLGDVDSETGRITDPDSDLFGKSVADSVLIFPTGRGSTVGPYVIYGLVRNRKAPMAMVNEKAEAIVATGAVISDIPMIDGIDTGLLMTGDRATVNGQEGFIELPDVEMKEAVTSFLINDGEVLILKRSEKVGTQKGKWAGVSGYLEEDESPESRSKQEILEETRMKGARMKKAGLPILARANETMWKIYPFLYEVDSREVVLDWEHVEHRWIEPSDVVKFDRVSRLRKALQAVLEF